MPCVIVCVVVCVSSPSISVCVYAWSCQVSTLQQDLQVKEKQYEVKLQVLEDSHRQSTLELREMLAALQQMSAKYDFHCCVPFLQLSVAIGVDLGFFWFLSRFFDGLC